MADGAKQAFKGGQALKAVLEANDLDVVPIILNGKLLIFDQFHLLCTIRASHGFCRILAVQDISKLSRNPHLLSRFEKHFPGTLRKLDEASADIPKNTKAWQNARKTALKQAGHTFDEHNARQFLLKVFCGDLGGKFNNVCVGCLGTTRSNSLREGRRQWCSRCASYRLKHSDNYLARTSLLNTGLDAFLSLKPSLEVSTPTNAAHPIRDYVYAAKLQDLLSKSRLAVTISQLKEGAQTPLPSSELAKIASYAVSEFETEIAHGFFLRDKEYLQPIADLYGDGDNDMLDIYGFAYGTFASMEQVVLFLIEQNVSIANLKSIAAGAQIATPVTILKRHAQAVRDLIKQGTLLNDFPTMLMRTAVNRVGEHARDGLSLRHFQVIDEVLLSVTRPFLEFETYMAHNDLDVNFRKARKQVYDEALLDDSSQPWAAWMEFVKTYQRNYVDKYKDPPRPDFSPRAISHMRGFIDRGVDGVNLWLHCSIAQSFADELRDGHFLAAEAEFFKDYKVVFKLAAAKHVPPWISPRIPVNHGPAAHVGIIDLADEFPLTADCLRITKWFAVYRK